MKISKTITNKWNNLYNSGDKTLLSELIKVSRSTIHRAFKGNGHPDVVNKINMFYIEREKQITFK